MKVCVYGVGAIGGLFAARLARGGVSVSGVARGATLASLRERGLVLIEGEARRRIDIAASDDPAALGRQDVVIVAVKTTAIESVAEGIAPLLTGDTVILSAMNGVPWWFFNGLADAPPGLRLPSLDPTGVLDRSMPASQVIGSVVHLSASSPEPGTVRHGAGRRVIIGAPAGPPDGRAEQVAELLRRGSFDVEVSDRIQRDIWYKLWGNMTMNPLSAITGATLDRILDDTLVRQFATRCMREAAQVGARIGLTITDDPEKRHEVTRALGAVRTSMLQDVDAGRGVELDALVTVVSELADALAVPAPNIDALLGLARLHARVRHLYP
ncbi:2-dehydropantoate 2-reductase [Amycolatopsis pithecellobii]|uniref:2-dehydropantoate 2-reductase n=1 Tax=Amycolatopsis pithecellobii TaxID=664692 RepID=A0A6N7Z6T6_9PSEU|nr:2-dehydropantoate 2-reductase [Amycolatopsis pithecellobii]MTD56570.1 2-dehydropantoate 2-reductase [Amycolatopsis pithecellobii]